MASEIRSSFHRPVFAIRIAPAVLAALAITAVCVPLLFLRSSPPKPAVQQAEQPRPAPESSAKETVVRPAPVEERTVQTPRSEPAAAVTTAPAVHAPVHVSAAEDTLIPVIDRRSTLGDERMRSSPDRPKSPEPTSAPLLTRRARGAEFGANSQTETAVDLGLAWLAAHQDASGAWDAIEFSLACSPGDRCWGPAVRRTQPSVRMGLTGLCVLAFLGAGYTDGEGPYQATVGRAVAALLRAQNEAGGFGLDDGMSGYNDALATFALAELYAQSRDRRLELALKAAAARLVRSQQTLGGWDYWATPESGRNDTSIMAWALQALQACAASGIDVPADALIRASLHLSRAAEADGRVRYSDAGEGFRLDGGLRPRYRYGPAMTACGALCEQLLGWSESSPLFARQRARLLADLPSATRGRGRDPTQLHSEYYWYYGTLAMFQSGGADWERWNASLRDAMLPLQDRRTNPAGARLHSFGSWDPYGNNWGKWGRMGGRVYTTAICTLTLETYYRHTPAYLQSPVIVTADDWQRFVAAADERDRMESVNCLSNLRVDLAEAALVDLLRDRSRGVAIAAAEALTLFGSPLGFTVLNEAVAAMPPWGRARTERFAERARALAALPSAIGRIVAINPKDRSVRVELDRAYLGMPLRVRHDGQGLTRLRVTRRSNGDAHAIAYWIEGEMPSPGDTVISE